jgi:hypothetical protein
MFFFRGSVVCCARLYSELCCFLLKISVVEVIPTMAMILASTQKGTCSQGLGPPIFGCNPSRVRLGCLIFGFKYTEMCNLWLYVPWLLSVLEGDVGIYRFKQCHSTLKVRTSEEACLGAPYLSKWDVLAGFIGYAKFFLSFWLPEPFLYNASHHCDYSFPQFLGFRCILGYSRAFSFCA